jgi:hypothetical protein
MAAILRAVGIVVVAAWLVLLFAREKFGAEAVPVTTSLLGVGLALTAAGIALGFFGRARQAVARSRCARCGTAIPRGDVYCRQHFRDTIDKMRDSQRK